MTAVYLQLFNCLSTLKFWFLVISLTWIVFPVDNSLRFFALALCRCSVILFQIKYLFTHSYLWLQLITVLFYVGRNKYPCSHLTKDAGYVLFLIFTQYKHYSKIMLMNTAMKWGSLNLLDFFRSFNWLIKAKDEWLS